eukprot:5460402-Alexandrium_andersonii.AAC.1
MQSRTNQRIRTCCGELRNQHASSDVENVAAMMTTIVVATGVVQAMMMVVVATKVVEAMLVTTLGKVHESNWLAR